MNEDSKQEIKRIVEYGLSLDLIKLIVSLSIRNNKTEVNDQLKIVIDNFFKSLDEDEKQEYKKEAERLVAEKVEKLKKELSINYGEDEIGEILNVVSQVKLFKLDG